MINNSQPVRNANVTLLYYDYYYPNSQGSVSNFTNENGTVIMTLPNVSRNSYYYQLGLSCLVEYQNKTHFSAVSQPFQQSPPDYQSSVITDRGFYDLNDVVYIKGYLRSYNASLQLQVPGTKKIVMQIYWNDNQTSYDFDFDQQYGSFSGNVTVPADSNFGNLYMNFYYLASNGNPMWFQNTPILIAEPKIPSALLTFESSNELVDPSSPTINITLSATTYTGIGIVGAKINLAWKLLRQTFVTGNQMYGFNQFNSIAENNGYNGGSRQTNQPTLPNEYGTFEFTIEESSGILKTNVSFQFENPANDGDTLSLQVTYLSPTNDLLSASNSIPFSATDLQIMLQTSTISDNILPNYEFGLFIDTQSLPSLESVPNKSVKVELRLWDGQGQISFNYQSNQINNIDDFPLLPQSQTCTTRSNNATVPLCKFNLPSFGNYILIASTLDSRGKNVFTVLPLLASVQRYNQIPLRTFPPIVVHSDKSEYKIGDFVNLSFFNPYRLQTNSTNRTSNVLVVFGNGYSSKSQIFPLLNTPTPNKSNSSFLDYETIRFQVGQECRYFCNVLLIFNWGSLTFHENTNSNDSSSSSGGIGIITPPGNNTVQNDNTFSQIRVSPLFEWNQPHSMTAQFSFPVQDQTAQYLNVTVTPQSPYVEPDSQTQITINLNVVNGATSSPTVGEVCIVVVDKSYLDLVPHPLIDLSTDMTGVINQNGYWYYVTTGEQFRSYLLYNNTLWLYNHLLKQNGWITPEWVLFPIPYSIVDIELTQEQFLAKYLSQLTDFPPVWTPSWDKGFGPGGTSGGSSSSSGSSSSTGSTGGNEGNGAPPPSPSPPSGNPDGGNHDSSGSSNTPTIIRSNFIATPLFVGKLLVNQTGTTKVNLTIPDNLSTFSIYAYAVSPTHLFGSAETSVISRKTVNMQPIAPNFVRIGDIFEIGVSLSSIPSFSGKVQVIVQTSCAKTSQKKNAQSIQLFTLNSTSNSQFVQMSNQNNNAQVLFTFQASRIGSAEFRFTLKLSDKVLDVLQLPLQVEPQQDSVYLATSLTITIDETSQKRVTSEASEEESSRKEIRTEKIRTPHSKVTENKFTQLKNLKQRIQNKPKAAPQLWNEAIDIPEDELGSGSLDIIISLGKKGFILQNSDYLLQLVNSSVNSGRVPSSVELSSSMVPVSLITIINSRLHPHLTIFKMSFCLQKKHSNLLSLSFRSTLTTSLVCHTILLILSIR